MLNWEKRMEIIASYDTNAGLVKTMNQDSLSVKVVNSPQGSIVFALVCDGMGGLEHGELASKEAILTLNQWFQNRFAKLVAGNCVTEEILYQQWQEEITKVNERLLAYADVQGVSMGTTLTALLLYKGNYYVCHVGDSRVYKIADRIIQVTEDHTLVAKEVELGYLTKEQALVDPRRSVLLQCVGASEEVIPQFEQGCIPEKVTFILSSDGFVHMLTEEEIYQYFRPDVIKDKEQLTSVCKETTQLVMERGERDNITVIAITCKA